MLFFKKKKKEEKKTIKISELELLNELDQKCSILSKHHIDDEFYCFYAVKNINWLIDNKDKIITDFEQNTDKLKFDIILNSTLSERNKLVMELKNVNVQDFSIYIDYLSYDSMNSKRKKSIDEMFECFKKKESEYDSIIFFDRICRKQN